MGFPLHPLESREEMMASKGLKKEKVTSPRREKQKSYLGPTADERQLSSARKSAIKESLGAILSGEGTPLSRTRPRPRPDDTLTSPRRTKSGGSILTAVATQAFAQPRRSISSTFKASGLYDDPFIDALLGAQSSTVTPVTPSSATQQNPRKLWHGLGLDQFKEKMGYKKTTTGDDSTSGHYSLDGPDTLIESESGMGGPNRKPLQKRSKSPSFLRQRTQATSHSERGTRSMDKALRRLSLSSHHTLTTSGEDSVPTSYSEHRRSIDVRLAPSRTCSDEQPFPSRWHQGGESSDLPPPPLGGASPGRHIRRSRKKQAKQDSFYGLDLEGELKDSQNATQSPKAKSPSTSSHRKNRIKSKVLLSKVSSSPRSPRSSSREKPSTKRVTSSLRTPSTRERKTVSVSTSPTVMTPSTISSCPRQVIESTEGWANLELDAFDATDTAEPILDQRYGNDIQTAMVVGENLMNLGVQLLTRGHDLKSAATRRNSLVSKDGQGSSKVETHVPIESDIEHIMLGTKYPPKHWDKIEKLEHRKEMGTTTSEFADDFIDDESEIESLAGIWDESRRRYDHQCSSGDLEAKHGTSLNSLSSNGASLASLLEGASSSNGTSFNSLMDVGSMDDDLDDEDLMFSDLHDAAYGTTSTSTTTGTHDSMNNSGLFGDSWRGLEFDFSDLQRPTRGLTGPTTKSRRKVGRHKSAPLEPVKKYCIPKGNKAPLGRPPTGKSKSGTTASSHNRDPGMDTYSTSY